MTNRRTSASLSFSFLLQNVASGHRFRSHGRYNLELGGYVGKKPNRIKTRAYVVNIRIFIYILKINAEQIFSAFLL